MKNLLRVIFAGLLSLPVSSCKTSQDSSFTCKADPEHLKAEWFEDNELDLPYYIVHFCRLAGAVVMEREHKGFKISPPVSKPLFSRR